MKIINMILLYYRLVEFGETPSSSLTLDEFMSVDLEEEHDPPSFKAARIRDRERLQKLLDTEVGKEFKEIQGKIEMELEKRRRKVLCKGGNIIGILIIAELAEGIDNILQKS